MSSLPEPSLTPSQGMQASGMTMSDVWLRYLGVGGDAGELEVEAYVLGLLVPSDHEHNMIAQAVNEHFIDEGDDHPVAYSDEIAGRPPAT